MPLARNGLLVFLAVAIISAAAGFGVVAAMQLARSASAGAAPTYFSSVPAEKRWGGAYLPNLEVVDQNGKTYRFYDDLVRGRKVVINFVFTSCSAICPLTMARMVQLREKLTDIPAGDLRFYSITVDPEHDGPAELKKFADAYGLGPDWLMLTGKPADLQIVRDKLGERSRMKSEHRHEMLLGNDPLGDWSKDSAYGDLDRVALNVRSMDPAWQKATLAALERAATADFAEIKQTPGEALFLKACASCHTIGRGVRVGPDLAGISKRRDAEWLKQMITRPDLVLARDDEISRDLKARFPSVMMPNLGLSVHDAADVLAYIDNAKS